MPKLTKEQRIEVLLQKDTPQNLAKKFGCKAETIKKSFDKDKDCIPMLKARLADEAFFTTAPSKEALNDWRCRWILKGYIGDMISSLYSIALNIDVADMGTFIDDVTYKVPIYENDTLDAHGAFNSFGIRKDFLDKGFFSDYNEYLKDIVNNDRPIRKVTCGGTGR